MPEHDARRMQLWDELTRADPGKDLAHYADMFRVDERTIRRDLSYLQGLLETVGQIELRRGRVYAHGRGFGTGYFTDHLERRLPEKHAIAAAVVDGLDESHAVLLTAGSTTYYVAREIRRVRMEEEDRLRGLIAFTNSLPALLELLSAGVSTGIVGEVYNPDDSAFHSHEFRSAFQPSVVIAGASGVVANPAAGTLELFSHRAEEAAFLKQMLAPVPEVVVAVDATKLGRRHPWSFTGGGALAGKTVRLVTTPLPAEQRETLTELAAEGRRTGLTFTFVEAAPRPG